MDLTTFGLDLATMAGIFGITQAIKTIINNACEKDIEKSNKLLIFLSNNIILLVIILGAITGVFMALKNTDAKLTDNITVMFMNIIRYAGGSVLFYSVYKQFVIKKE